MSKPDFEKIHHYATVCVCGGGGGAGWYEQYFLHT